MVDFPIPVAMDCPMVLKANEDNGADDGIQEEHWNVEDPDPKWGFDRLGRWMRACLHFVLIERLDAPKELLKADMTTEAQHSRRKKQAAKDIQNAQANIRSIKKSNSLPAEGDVETRQARHAIGGH